MRARSENSAEHRGSPLAICGYLLLLFGWYWTRGADLTAGAALKLGAGLND